MAKKGKQGYWAITWIQLKKKKLAMSGLYFVGVLALLATYAPYISSDVPFMYTFADETSYPFWSELFNSNRFGAYIDIVYNLFSFFLLPMILLSLIFKKIKNSIKWIWTAGLSLFLVLFFVIVNIEKLDVYNIFLFVFAPIVLFGLIFGRVKKFGILIWIVGLALFVVPLFFWLLK